MQDASSTACIQSANGTATVTINPLPTATIAGTTAVCKDAVSPEITFTGANGTAPYTFTYRINSGSNQTVSTISGNTVTVSAPTGITGTFTYTLVSVQDASTTACSQAQSGTAVITVNPLPTATITGTTAVCQNSTSPNITFTGANGTAPYTFTYTINSGTPQTVTTIAWKQCYRSSSYNCCRRYIYLRTGERAGCQQYGLHTDIDRKCHGNS